MPPERLDPVAAFEAIQGILGRRDTLAFTRHALSRGSNRSFNIDDVRRVLMRGTVSPDPEWDEEFQNWKYRVRGVGYDGEPLTVVIALEPEFDRITVITAYD